MSETNNPSTSCAYTYTVKRGDSFYLIARRLGVPLRDLMNANAGISPTQLMVGDVLCVPSCVCDNSTTPERPEANVPETPVAPPPPETPPAFDGPDTNTPATCPAERQTVVAEGQTVADLQIAYDKSYRTLEAANPDVDLQNLQAGQTLCIPEINIACALPSSVVLGENESLASVAVRYNLPVAAILRANPCLAPDDFMQGVTVKLPQ